MLFNSFAFGLFICVVLAAVALLPTRARVWLLIAVSYLFYSVSYPPWVVLLAIVTVVDYHLAQWLDTQESRRRRAALLVASCVLNLGLLAFYKYAAFLAGSLNDLFAAAGADLRLPIVSVGLPLGISFFVFESMSYVVDVYRRRLAAIRRFEDYTLFIAFFPHLIAGPIVRARDFIPQIARHVPFERENTIRGTELIAIGFFKKTVIADNCSPLVEAVYANPSAAGGAAIWLATLFFAVQIYCDFSGYTDIARGLARVMGFDLGQNFNFPYLSGSIREFWRRWHISLSSWLRDYLYIPLGGSRKGRARTALALSVTWFLGGLWHGAAWHFVAWGLYHGALASLSAVAVGGGMARVWAALSRPVHIAATFTAVVFGWVLFRADSLPRGLAMWRAMVSPWDSAWTEGLEAFSTLSLWLLGGVAAVHVLAFAIRRHGGDQPFLVRAPYPVRAAALATLGVACFLFAGKAQTFIYFQF